MFETVPAFAVLQSIVADMDGSISTQRIWPPKAVEYCVVGAAVGVAVGIAVGAWVGGAVGNAGSIHPLQS